jgi:hypothetical protein
MTVRSFAVRSLLLNPGIVMQQPPTGSPPTPAAKLPKLIREALGGTSNYAGMTPLPDRSDLLMILLAEAKTFLDALEPVRRNFRVLEAQLDRLRKGESLSQGEMKLLSDRVATNRTLVLSLGPRIPNIVEYLERDPVADESFRTAFGDPNEGPVELAVPDAWERFKQKRLAIERFAEHVQNLEGRLLEKLAQPTVHGQRQDVQQVIPRIQVSVDPPLITFEGVAYASELPECVFAQELLKARGNWVSSKELESHPQLQGCRLDRLKQKLPQPLQSLIKSKRGAGYCLPVE